MRRHGDCLHECLHGDLGEEEEEGEGRVTEDDRKSNLILNLLSWVNFLEHAYCIFENLGRICVGSV